MTHEYENFLQRSNIVADDEQRQMNITSAEFIGDDTDSEASYMTDNEEGTHNNASRARLSSNISDISDFSLNDLDTDDEDDMEDRVCSVCGDMGGRIWCANQNRELFICRDCFTLDPNNINHTEARNLIASLGPDGVQEIIQEENLTELETSSILNPDINSNYELNHQGVEYLAVEAVFELVTHGGFLSRSDFNHFLDIVAFVCHRPNPDTGHHRGLSDRERSIYSTVRSTVTPRTTMGREPLIELEIPQNNEAWSYPGNNTQARPVLEVHNHYLIQDYAPIVATCALYMAHNFTNIRYS